MMDADQFARIDARRADFTADLAREFARYNEHRMKWRGRLAGKGRSSRCKMHLESIGRRYGVSAAGHGPLDMLAGYLILGTMGRPDDYLAYTRATVDRYMEQYAHLRHTYPTELTPAGEQLVIPGCERVPPKAGKPAQLSLWG